MPTSMSLEYVIVHPMDHQNRSLTLSNRLTVTDQLTQQALCQQMFENRDYEYAQPFVFDSTGSDLVSRQYDAIISNIANPDSFIRASQAITQHLYTIIEGNHNVTVGHLLIGMFREDNNDPWLAIMKMQPAGDTYVLESIAAQASGDVGFAIRVSSGALLGGVLQKCAFVAPPSLRTAVRDLIVYDQQALKRGNEQPAARFFNDKFLGCKIKISDREMTRNFSGVLKKAAREHTKDWGSAATDVVIETMNGLQQGARIDVYETLEELVPEQDRAVVLEALREKRVTAPVFRVELPPSRVEQQEPEYIWLEGDNGILLRIQKDAYDRGDVLVPTSPELGQKRFIMRTTDLVPVTPPFN